MADSFTLPIEFNGEEHEYPAQILRYGFTHKIEVTINETTVTFEPDEEGNYRASIPPESTANISRALLAEISKALVYLFGE